ncbi:MAG: hypothetical protein IJG33_09395 [Selenomonadaceae bacterium]|nr:hypothetical protein [Selenomonadaceae bacterium]
MKKIFTAVILAVFILSAQIAFAYDYDWNKAPRFGNKAEFARYVENGRRTGQKVFKFALANFKVNSEAEHKAFARELYQYIATAPYYLLEPKFDGFPIEKFTYTITQEYIGVRVANAYRSGDTSKLTAEEKKLYNIAVGIVYEANKRSSEVEKARYIHDVICDSVYEYKNENNRNGTAIGVLIDHYAQCGGYADAFYMLGRMAGLNVRRINGTFDGGWHFWNTITLSDGRTYCVDVTMDDGYNTDEWFLANFEVMRRHHSCEWSIIPNLQ